MKKTLTSFLLITLTTTFSPTLMAQNLVPNWSFESYNQCPYAESQFSYVNNWIRFQGGAEYFNSCDTTNYVGVPSNRAGYQQASSGHAYMGLYGYGFRDYMGVQLFSPLIIGTKYYVNFKISATIIGIPPFGTVRYVSNKMGALFTTTTSTQYPTPNFAQVYIDSIISDSVLWTTVRGSFIADSAYKYVVIGNFFVDSLTSAILINPSGTWAFAYYYIDDVCVSVDSMYCETLSYIAENYMQKGINVYPNPARNQIEINGSDIQSLTLYDVLGRVIYLSKPEIITPITINTSSFSRGIYFLQAQTKAGMVVRKVVLE